MKRENRPNACMFWFIVQSPRTVHWSLFNDPVPEPWKLLSRPLRFPSLPRPMPLVYGSRSLSRLRDGCGSRILQVCPRNHVARECWVMQFTVAPMSEFAMCHR